MGAFQTLQASSSLVPVPCSFPYTILCYMYLDNSSLSKKSDKNFVDRYDIGHLRNQSWRYHPDLREGEEALVDGCELSEEAPTVETTERGR